MEVARREQGPRRAVAPQGPLGTSGQVTGPRLQARCGAQHGRVACRHRGAYEGRAKGRARVPTPRSASLQTSGSWAQGQARW